MGSGSTERRREEKIHESKLILWRERDNVHFELCMASFLLQSITVYYFILSQFSSIKHSPLPLGGFPSSSVGSVMKLVSEKNGEQVCVCMCMCRLPSAYYKGFDIYHGKHIHQQRQMIICLILEPCKTSQVLLLQPSGCSFTETAAVC